MKKIIKKGIGVASAAAGLAIVLALAPMAAHAEELVDPNVAATVEAPAPTEPVVIPEPSTPEVVVSQEVVEVIPEVIPEPEAPPAAAVEVAPVAEEVVEVSEAAPAPVVPLVEPAFQVNDPFITGSGLVTNGDICLQSIVAFSYDLVAGAPSGSPLEVYYYNGDGELVYNTLTPVSGPGQYNETITLPAGTYTGKAQVSAYTGTDGIAFVPLAGIGTNGTFTFTVCDEPAPAADVNVTNIVSSPKDSNKLPVSFTYAVTNSEQELLEIYLDDTKLGEYVAPASGSTYSNVFDVQGPVEGTIRVVWPEGEKEWIGPCVTVYGVKVLKPETKPGPEFLDKDCCKWFAELYMRDVTKVLVNGKWVVVKSDWIGTGKVKFVRNGTEEECKEEPPVPPVTPPVTPPVVPPVAPPVPPAPAKVVPVVKTELAQTGGNESTLPVGLGAFGILTLMGMGGVLWGRRRSQNI